MVALDLDRFKVINDSLGTEPAMRFWLRLRLACERH